MGLKTPVSIDCDVVMSVKLQGVECTETERNYAVWGQEFLEPSVSLFPGTAMAALPALLLLLLEGSMRGRIWIQNEALRSERLHDDHVAGNSIKKKGFRRKTKTKKGGYRGMVPEFR